MSGTLLVIALSGLNPLNPGDPIGKTPWLWGRDMLLVLGVGSILAVALFFWATRYVRRQRRHRRHHTTPGILQAKSKAATEDGAEPRHHHRRRRRRRRQHLDRQNRHPTLAETGGLPPARTAEGHPPASANPPV
jgi:hypothetical protein